jgi:hypothetical protein
LSSSFEGDQHANLLNREPRPSNETSSSEPSEEESMIEPELEEYQVIDLEVTTTPKKKKRKTTINKLTPQRVNPHSKSLNPNNVSEYRRREEERQRILNQDASTLVRTTRSGMQLSPLQTPRNNEKQQKN